MQNWDMAIEGENFIADLLRTIIENFARNQNLKRDFTTDICLPAASYIDFLAYITCFILLVTLYLLNRFIPLL